MECANILNKHGQSYYCLINSNRLNFTSGFLFISTGGYHMSNLGMFESQYPELQRYSLDELITFIYDKLQNHKEIKIQSTMLFLIQQIWFDQMHRITQE